MNFCIDDNFAQRTLLTQTKFFSISALEILPFALCNRNWCHCCFIQLFSPLRPLNTEMRRAKGISIFLLFAFFSALFGCEYLHFILAEWQLNTLSERLKHSCWNCSQPKHLNEPNCVFVNWSNDCDQIFDENFQRFSQFNWRKFLSRAYERFGAELRKHGSVILRRKPIATIRRSNDTKQQKQKDANLVQAPPAENNEVLLRN